MNVSDKLGRALVLKAFVIALFLAGALSGRRHFMAMLPLQQEHGEGASGIENSFNMVNDGHLLQISLVELPVAPLRCFAGTPFLLEVEVSNLSSVALFSGFEQKAGQAPVNIGHYLRRDGESERREGKRYFFKSSLAPHSGGARAPGKP